MDEHIPEVDMLYYDNDSPWMLWCKGHVTPEAFLEGAKRYVREQEGADELEVWEDDFEVIPSRIKHIYLRTVPTSSEFARIIYLAAPGRGAYKATCYEVC